ncbi:MAG: hypothetical protein ACI4UU_03135 [Clostridia bacterium]
MNLGMDEHTINRMENAEERYGMLNQSLNSRVRIKRATEEALEECNIPTHTIKEIRESCATIWEIHIGGILKREQREKLVECIAKKMNYNKNSIRIIAFYN